MRPHSPRSPHSPHSTYTYDPCASMGALMTRTQIRATNQYGQLRVTNQYVQRRAMCNVQCAIISTQRCVSACAISYQRCAISYQQLAMSDRRPAMRNNSATANQEHHQKAALQCKNEHNKRTHLRARARIHVHMRRHAISRRSARAPAPQHHAHTSGMRSAGHAARSMTSMHSTDSHQCDRTARAQPAQPAQYVYVRPVRLRGRVNDAHANTCNEPIRTITCNVQIRATCNAQ